MKKLTKNEKLIILIAIILIVVIIGIVVSVNVIKINIANGKYNSANSNSSSANLLPEYIKEGITLGGVTGSLIDLDTSDATATEWDITYGKTAYVDGKKITGIFVPRSSLKVGDYVDYTPDTASDYSISSTVSGYTTNQTIRQDKSLKWQIMSVNNDGTIDLISNIPTSQLIYFNGAIGYNNGVYILNDICKKQYSNENLGTVGRSVKIEDVLPKMNNEGKNAIQQWGTIKYGNTKQYYNAYYPNLYAQENGSGINTNVVKTDGIEQSDNYYSNATSETCTQVNTLTITQNYYNFDISELNNYFDDANFFKLILEASIGHGYWLASRYQYCDEYHADFSK